MAATKPPRKRGLRVLSFEFGGECDILEVLPL